MGPTDWIVVKVVVKDLTDGAGEENVLSSPRRPSKPPFAVRCVPATEEAICDGAWMECDVSCSVETVPAIERLPAVAGGAGPSPDKIEPRLRPSSSSKDPFLLVRAVDNDG